MPKPKSTNPRQTLKVRLDPDIYAEIRLRLYNPDYAYGFQHGAVSAFINGVLRAAFQAEKAKAPAPAAKESV